MATCPRCKMDSPDVYIGISRVECPNPNCVFYVKMEKKVEPVGNGDLKMWIWGVLPLCTDGMVICLAQNEKDAWEKLKEKDAQLYATIRGYISGDNREPDDLPVNVIRPKVFDSSRIVMWKGMPFPVTVY